jgi:hypothetical protein
MSEQSGGPGWWIASDGKWYPPEQAQAPAATAPALTPPTPPTPAPPGAGQPSNSNGKLIVALVVAGVLIVIGVVVVLTRDSDSASSKGSLDAFCAKSAEFRADDLSGSDISSNEKNKIGLDRIQQLAKEAPPEIKPDIDTLIEGTKVIVAVGNGELDKIDQFDQAKVTKASKNLEKFLVDNCGVKLGSDESS